MDIRSIRQRRGGRDDPSCPGGRVARGDPTSGIKLLHGPNDEIGHHTWTQDELDRFEAHWPVATRERLAYDLLLYTGLRRGDASV